MGKRKFGKVLRRGSVAILKKVEDMLDSATSSQGAKQAAVSSILIFSMNFSIYLLTAIAGVCALRSSLISSKI